MSHFLSVSYFRYVALKPSQKVKIEYHTSSSLHRQMQSRRFILASFGLTQAQAWPTCLPYYAITCDSAGCQKPKNPCGEQELETYSPNQCAMPQTLRGFKGFMLQNKNDTWKTNQNLKSRLIQAQNGPPRDGLTIYRQHDKTSCKASLTANMTVQLCVTLGHNLQTNGNSWSLFSLV